MNSPVLFSGEPKIGLLIGTYGSPSYVHLHLQNARRLYPGLDTLVHDDCSREQDSISQLCWLFGADFTSQSRHHGHQLGELSCFNEGLKWAIDKGVDLLVKMSRRWIPMRDWRAELSSLCLEGQYATYTSYCQHHRLFYRTECVAMHVPSWSKHREEIEEASKNGSPDFPTEEFLYRLGKKVHASVSDKPGSYVQWPLVNEDRFVRNPDVLWHDYASPEEYCGYAKFLGLEYDVKDFRL